MTTFCTVFYESHISALPALGFKLYVSDLKVFKKGVLISKLLNTQISRITNLSLELVAGFYLPNCNPYNPKSKKNVTIRLSYV